MAPCQTSEFIALQPARTVEWETYFDNLRYWRPLVSLPEDQGYVVYGGDQSLQTSAGALVSWRQLDRIPV